MTPGKNIITLLIASFLILSCNRNKAVFTSLSPSSTNIDFVNTPQRHKLFNILYYLYYYNGGGVATGDVNNDGLPDLYFTANSKGNNKLYLNKGNFSFEDITASAGVAGISDWCSGVTMADVNGDGNLDIYVSAVSKSYDLNGHNQLFINNGNNTFTDKSIEYGLNFSGLSTQAAFFDYDHDGDLDCYILNHSKQPHANIIDTSNRRKFDEFSGDRLYRNDLSTTKKFTDVSAQAGIFQSNLGYGLGIAISDINNDGWEDIYIGNDFHENDYYYVNNGNGTFTESGAKHFGHYSRFSMGNDVADYNNDGQLDIITVDMLPPDEKVLKTYGSDENPDIYKVKLKINGYQDQYSKNCLQRNNGNGNSFSETALISGVSATDWSWSPLFADFDNDGKKDLFISSGIVRRPVDLDYVRFISDLKMKGMDRTDKFDDEAISGMPDGASHPFFFKGDGNLTFTDVSEAWGTAKMKGYFNGASYADLDNDGNLDVVMNCIDAPAVILKNNSPKKNYISITLKGDGLNKHGIGAKTYIFSKNKSGQKQLQYQQLMLTRGFQSSSDHRMHFGLDSVNNLDSILIVWPDQKMQLIKNVSTNKQLSFSQKDASGKFEYAAWFPPLSPILSLNSGITANWKHRENDFVDYNKQYLIPHAQSTRGPKIAVADVNGDGLDDFYTCGAKGQPGSLQIQQKDGGFVSSNNMVFEIDAGCEDVDAIFFDANGDKTPDLYVVSGGNEAVGQDITLLDRLYLNDGKGSFTKSTTLPPVYENKSCVSVADIDKDGDLDLFVGNLANARAYGVPQTSYLLVNDGKGVFSFANQTTISLNNIGNVTSASFSDINKDSWPDLVVTGEWMPIHIFTNNNGKFVQTSIPRSTGWWQTIFLDDVNNDGAMDILAGNWGCNNKFWSGKNGPVRLYVSDFDKNGQTDHLLSYTLNGVEFPFLAKDEVERALPVLRKHYLLYADYAGVPMKDVFYGFAETVEPLIAEKMASAVCYGDGKGGFAIQDLPAELQLAPIFSFQKVAGNSTENKYIAGGNFFDVIPYEGKYDAQPLALFNSTKDKKINYLYQPGILDLKEQVRDIKWLRTTSGNVMTVAANNSGLLFYNLHSTK